MLAGLLDLAALNTLSRDGILLFATRMLRMFAYGIISVVLFLYLTGEGSTGLAFSPVKAGWLLTLTLLGDTAISLLITTRADRIGRKSMLILGSLLMLAAGIVFVLTNNFWILLIAATIGVISPSGNEVGPFLAIEQAALSHLIPGEKRTGVFAWYNLAGLTATACGALAAGFATKLLQSHAVSTADSYRTVLAAYSIIGALLIPLFLLVSRAIEVSPPVAAPTPQLPITNYQLQPPPSAPTLNYSAPAPKLFLGLHKSKHVILKLSALFSLDAFAGAFVLQSLLAYWFHVKFGADEATLGTIFFFANILAALSALSASKLASKFGLINTMVFTHIPSNLLLILVPLMPNLPLAITLLLARFSISQMDVPTRQSFTMAVVDPDERSAAAGITGIARTTGAALSPAIASSFLQSTPLLSLPFYLSGTLKILYDLLLWRSFKAIEKLPPK